MSFNASIQKKDAFGAKWRGCKAALVRRIMLHWATANGGCVGHRHGGKIAAQAPLQWVIEHGQAENRGAAFALWPDIQMQLNQRMRR